MKTLMMTMDPNHLTKRVKMPKKPEREGGGEDEEEEQGRKKERKTERVLKLLGS
jgi:hypothetical protein